MLLSVENLRVAFRMGRENGQVRRVEAVGRGGVGIGFEVPENTTVALVGESGSGKSVTAMSIINLLPDNAERTGTITFDGRDLIHASGSELRRLRGRAIACVFQEPMTSLNPVFTVGRQITEPLVQHLKLSSRQALQKAEDLLNEVGLPEPKRRLAAYPHELSGGQQQRVMIAMALACEPRLLIADEPTTALDVTIQAQILDLMRELREETGTAIILITHDLGVVAELADDVAVMYAGRIVERASVATLFTQPQHPYTVGLLGSIPALDVEQQRLPAIEGLVPNPMDPIAGCRFHPRCPFAIERCRREDPPLIPVGGEHLAACWRAPLDADTLVPA